MLGLQGRRIGLGIKRHNGEHDPARHSWPGAFASVHEGSETQDQQAGEEAALEDVS